MTMRRDQFKSSYGAFTSRERELERNRALRDAREAAQEKAITVAVAEPLAETRRARG